VGSGKSSLLSALLGEMECVSGRVNIRCGANIAYVPQLAWIQNATLKDNIVFGHPLDAKLYNRVLKACALKQDLLTLSAGDQTEIGEKGINLSGGQKQRVSLARAVYSDADLYLLDDPLSAVDSHVGKHIMDEVLDSKTGLLRNKTRILVTNQLFVLPNVDLIVVLKEGKIGSIGTYEQLILTATTTRRRRHSSDAAPQHRPDPQYRVELIRQIVTDKTDGDDDEEAAALIRRRTTTSTGPTIPTPTPVGAEKKDILVAAESVETGDVKLAVYAKYGRAMTPLWTALIIFSYMAFNAVNSGSNFWLNAWSAESSADRNGYYLGIYALFGVMQVCVVCMGWTSIITGTLCASKNLHERLLRATLHAPMSFFDTTPLGRVLNRFSKDIDIMDSSMQMTMRVLVNTSFQVLSTIVIISIQTPIFLAVFFPVMIVYYFIQKFYVVTSRQLKRLESITRSPIYSHFGETVNGVSTIRAYGVNDRFIRESDARVDRNQMCYYPNAIANCWLQVRLEVLANCLIFFAALFAVLSKGSMNPGEIGLSISYAMNITLALNACVRMFAEMENNVVAVERVDEYCGVESEAEWYSGQKIPDNWPNKG
ncbi:unnamed protein product, partial [Medioppia subpectinata]